MANAKSPEKGNNWSNKKVTSFLKRALGEVVDFSAPPPEKKEILSEDPPPPKNPLTEAIAAAPKEKPLSRKNRAEKIAKPAAPIIATKNESPLIAAEDPPAATKKRRAKRRKSSSFQPLRSFRSFFKNDDDEDNSGEISSPKTEGGRSLGRKALMLAAAVVLLLFSACALFSEGEEPVPQNVDYRPVYVRIQGGMAATNIAKLLEEKGIIVSAKDFIRKLRRTKNDGRIQSGNYKMHRGMRNTDVIDMLVNGQTAVIRFTIPEGYTLREIAKTLENDGIVKAADLLQEAKNFAPYPYIENVPEAPYRLEGFLFPDTYEVPPGASARDILSLMTRTFDERLTNEMRSAAKKYNFTIHEYVTLASLIEKEAMYAEDRPLIAQVFLKRLRISMPLQSDAPFQYLRETPKEDLTYADTKVDSPYNTYKYYGLPPGPIASPGKASLEALAQPADTDYLYFVADRQGHNHYSNTYSEHLALVEKYR